MRALCWKFTRVQCKPRYEEVATPDQFNLQYEDVTLDTADHVKVKAYYMMQRRDVDSTSKEASEEDVAVRVIHV